MSDIEPPVACDFCGREFAFKQNKWNIGLRSIHTTAKVHGIQLLDHHGKACKECCIKAMDIDPDHTSVTFFVKHEYGFPEAS